MLNLSEKISSFIKFDINYLYLNIKMASSYLKLNIFNYFYHENFFKKSSVKYN